MRTSWKLAGGIAALALLIYSMSGHENPKTEPAAKPISVVAPSAPPREPARSPSGDEIRGTAVLASKSEQPIAEGPCTASCFEQEAGYNWAEQMRIDDPVDCDNDSSSFVEGCLAYAEPQQAEIDDSWEDR